MADTLHMSLSKFRDTMLTAIARLEFELRDTMDTRSCDDIRPTRVAHAPEHDYRVSKLSNDMETLSSNLQVMMEKMSLLEQRISSPKEVQDLMNIEPPRESRNIVISSSVKSTPALSAAVTSLHPPSMNLSEKDEDEVADTEDEVADTEDEVEEGDDEVEEIINEESEVEVEIEGSVQSEEEKDEEKSEGEVVEEEEEEEEEGVEVEEFEYKGITYQRDAENNVYYDGNHIGTWTECQVKKKDGTMKMEWRIVKLPE